MRAETNQSQLISDINISSTHTEPSLLLSDKINMLAASAVVSDILNHSEFGDCAL